jgi:DNA-binding beta-propeller fold protein YncE
MRRHLPLYAAALVPLCGAAALCALALAPRAAGQHAVHMNGNLTPASNTNSNTAPSKHELIRPQPTPRPVPRPPSVSWRPVPSVPGYYGEPRVTLRADAGPRAAVVAQFDQQEYPEVSILRVEGEFLRVRAERDGKDSRAERSVEGWAAWGEVMPQTTALVLDVKTGRVLARRALGDGVDSVSFSPDGTRALFHGPWASVLYEADASDFALTRRLAFEGEGTFSPPVYVGAGHDLLVPFWSNASQTGNTAPTVYAVHTYGGGGTRVTPFGRAPSGAEPSRVVFAPDGRTGFAFYNYPYGDEGELPEDDERASANTIEVFDPLTLQKLRHFKAPTPGIGFDPGSSAMNADGSELYALDHTLQRLLVIETQSGGVVREVSLAGETQRLLSLDWLDADGPRLRYWEVTEDHHGEGRQVRLDGGRAVVDESGHAFVVEAGGTRYAVDEAGARLLTLDADGRAVKVHDIPRRENDYQVPRGLFVTPDGARLVLILGLAEDGC